MGDKTLSFLMLDKKKDKVLIKQLCEAAKNISAAASKEGIRNTSERYPETPESLRRIAQDLTAVIRQRNEARSSCSLPWESLDRIRDIIKSVLKQYKDSKDLFGQLESVSNSKQYDEARHSGKPVLPRLEERDRSTDSINKDYGELSDKETRCLLGLCLLPEGVMVSKTELIYWCKGLGFEGFDYGDDPLLLKLVEKGWVTQITTIPYNLSKRYIVRSSQVRDIIVDTNRKDEKKAALMDFDKVEVLGRRDWENNKGREQNKVILQSDYLKDALGKLKHAKYLSLRGIYKLMKLPAFISDLEDLLILDLRECHNLVSLPSDIDHLKNLQHLDLSQCYVLDDIPIEISLLPDLRVLKGFIIQATDPPKVETHGNMLKYFKEKISPSSSSAASSSPSCSFGRLTQKVSKCCKTKASSFCPFGELGKLKKLQKLTIRTRRMGFPTKEDLDTLCKLESLRKLGIAWVGNRDNAQTDSDLDKFPATVEKLELQCATHQTTSTLLKLAAENENSSKLKKVYIKGGGIRNLSSVPNTLASVETVRLRYLPEFEIEWDEFKRKFPSLVRLEAHKSHGLVYFPCDQNGIWEDIEY